MGSSSGVNDTVATTTTATATQQWESEIVTVLLLSIVTALAIWVNDLTFALSFSGATMSSLIIYVFPPIMFSTLVQNCTGCGMKNEQTDREVKVGYVMMASGIVLGV